MNQNKEIGLREEVVTAMKALDARGLNRGTSGNISVRCGDDMLVTPSGISPAEMYAGQVVRISANGEWSGSYKPSSEWQMHRGILDRRSDVNAVVHCHSQYATILACAHREIPPLHYMVAVGGAHSVPVAPYESFGTAQLASITADTLGMRNAVLMANHGQIAVGLSLRRALAIAEEIENQAAIYFGTLMIGGPKLLNASQMDEILTRFRKSYGQSSVAEEPS